jgi:NAD(P)-dependent dehydrogenase (short-subunit alcohol dehydrogenase family)
MKVAIVTGASRGIGAATARLLGARGYSVAVNYLRERAKAQGVADDICLKGGKAIAVQADMGVEADILRLFDTVDRDLGAVTALVNNAGLNRSHGSGAVEEMPWELVESVFRVNVLGVFAACREAVKRMKTAGSGAVVNVSSEAGRFGGNKMAHYAASKAAINTFTVAFAREAAAHNIRVNAVSPGIIDTDAHSAATPERLAALRASLPLGRMGTPAEVAETVAWLLSDAASYVSGSLVSVAGAR